MTTVVVSVTQALVGQVGQVSRGSGLDVTAYNSVNFTSPEQAATASSYLATNVAFTSSVPSFTVVVPNTVIGVFKVVSSLAFSITPTRQDASVAFTSTIFSETSPTLTASVNFAATATPTSTLRTTVIESFNTTSVTNPGKTFSVTSGNSVAFTDSVTQAMTAALSLTATTNLTSSVTTVFVPRPEIDTTTFKVVSTVTPGPTTTSGFLEGDVSFESMEYHIDPTREAWVLNTETTALSRYDSFGFNSIAVLNGQTLAAGPDGLYLLGGAKDDGSFINASMQTGFMDFKEPSHKRIDSVYVGHTTDGDTHITAETYGPTPGSHTFKMEKRTASAPRASRAIIAKGLTSRYWRFTYGNIQGADFAVDRIDMNVMVTGRRV